MAPTIRSIVISFIVLLVAFRSLELLRPSDKRLPVLRRGFWTDLVYWAFTPLVTRVVTGLGVAAVAVPIAHLIYGHFDRNLIVHGYGPASRLPLWLQAIAILLLGDFIGYWMHRAFHGRRLWRFHAVHHSSVDLDWLSAVRLHPVNDVLMRIAGTLPILVFGFAPIGLTAVIPILTLLAILVHAHLDWDWGRLRWLIVSPRFHRWHHTDESEARDKNFAGLLPLWDILFGTYHMPSDRCPASFGTATPVPGGLFGQLAFPFRSETADIPATRDQAAPSR
ncbi:MAG TPA: sterol desaturase family protein [Bradyrhizobium sp.]|uniref:sterol desaturase family protein n=1 Tax=Bradyrhizobium sp. TaxID=376 RepID=UPI002CBB3395|nr:sterol desaturase family protein [Bradyrhizobium sp.]HLZ00523.1 sterol desaturase family protein [Bradyrhizobium sp.]